MAKVGDGTLVVWTDGQDVDAVDINRNFEVLRVANNDTDTKAIDATSTIDTKVNTVQTDLNNKYNELVQVDTDTNNLLIENIADVRSEFNAADANIRTEFRAADSNLQTQVNTKITSQETDEKISAAIATVVAGNAVIPVGNQFPDPGDGRVDGEEFILTGSDGSRILYFYNINTGMWEVATKVIPIDAPTTQQFNDYVSSNNTALNAHTSNNNIHVTSSDKATWSGKQTNLQNVNSIELAGNMANNTVTAVDFHTNPNQINDYDARILTMGSTSTQNGRAAMQIEAYDLTIKTPTDSISISGLKQSVSDGKAQVAAAITGKGQTTAADATFSVMANNIGNISTDPKTTSGNFNSGVVTSGANETKTFSLTGVSKQPVAFVVSFGSGQVFNSSGSSTAMTLSTNPEFVSNVINRTVSTSFSGLTITFSVSSSSLTVTTNFTSSATIASVRYTLGSWTVIY